MLRDTIRGYQLQERLDSGGFGSIYRAYQPSVGREVAVKVIRPEYADHPDFIRRFESEAQLVARLEHPHIVPLYDYWREPGGAYLVMRLLRGGSLKAELANGPVSPERALEITGQIAGALDYAHSKGVIHRDLKPGNVLLDEAGNAYLSDFGIAKGLAEPEDLTRTTGTIGSPLYMAPEQILGEPITVETDIYALGLVVYALLSGEAPYPDETYGALVDKQLHQPLPALRGGHPAYPLGLDEVLAKATAKPPEARYPSALDFLGALRGVITGQGELPEVELANPYKGLRPFLEADAGNFFGREALTARLLARLGENNEYSRFLAVVGPSGSGKSSVVRAGLIPALSQGALPDSADWYVVEMLPGAHPFEELELGLLRVASRADLNLSNQLSRDERGLLRAARLVLPENGQLLLVIDQFEEIFTLVEAAEKTRSFMENLYAAVREARSPVRVIVTLRADFYDRPLMYPDFAQLVQERTEVVVPLTVEELDVAIRKPAEQVGAGYEASLVASIVGEVIEQPGALPLLQYALTELFERREGRVLTREAYETIGGVAGALGRRAEEVYLALEAPQQAAAKQIFLRLVTLGEGVEDTRRRVLLSELETLTIEGSSADEQVAEVLETFGKARLLSFDRDPLTRGPTVEVAHEALLREWVRLREWLDESRADLRLQRVLANAAGDWEANDKDASFLLRGSRLEQYADWVDTTALALTEKEQAYLVASLADEAERVAQREKLERRLSNFLRALIVVMALAVVIALSLSWFAFRQRDSARQAALAEAAARRQASSRELVRFAEAELQAPTDPTFSLELLLARQAVLTTWQADQMVLDEAERALRNAINSAPILDHALAGHTGRVLYADWSPDGSQVVSSGADATARIWDALSGSQRLVLDGHTGEINTAVWSPDGTQILTGSRDKTVRTWDASSGQLLQEYPIGLFVTSAMWSPDGSRLLVTAEDMVQILNAQSGETLLQKQGVTGDFSFAAWDPSGNRFATADTVNTLAVWDAETGEQLGESLEANRGPMKSVQWSHSGRYLLSTHFGNLARIWDLQEQNPPIDLEHEDSVQFAAWDPGDRQVATVTADSQITIWDAQTGEKLRLWRPHDQIIRSVVWSPDGSHILTADGDGLARIWETRSLGQRNSLPHPGPVLSVDWSPDGLNLVTAGGLTFSANIWDVQESFLVQRIAFPGSVDVVAWSPDGSQVAVASLGTIYIQDAVSGKEVAALTGHNGNVNALAWSPSGEYLATGAQDRTARIWDVAAGETLQVLSGHSGAVLSVGWSADETRLLTASRDQTARVWDLQNGAELLRLQGHSDFVNAAVYSPDGETVLTASSDQTARLWDAATGELLYELDHRGAVWTAGWHPEGSLIATAGDEGVVLLWDPQTGEQEGEAAHHAGPVWSLAWSPDGSQIASASQDSTAQISRVGIDELLDQAEGLIRRTPPEFSGEERCLYLHDCTD